jgi:hypothetical protein
VEGDAMKKTYTLKRQTVRFVVVALVLHVFMFLSAVALSIEIPVFVWPFAVLLDILVIGLVVVDVRAKLEPRS